MSGKQAYVYFHASYCGKINQIHDSDIFQLKIGIPDKHNLFATLEGGSEQMLTTLTKVNNG